MAELAISGAFTVVMGDAPADAFAVHDIPGAAVIVTPSSDARCDRCWRHLPDVAEDTGLCGRCAEAIAT
jgi:isoleucyl-tRNA synthetase